MVQLLVIYDPAENRNLYGGGGKTMTAGSWGHHWTRFPNAPFQTTPTLFVNKRVRLSNGRELFENLNQVLFRNIDYLFVWFDEPLTDAPNQIGHGQNQVIDDTDDLEGFLNSQTIGRMREVSHQDVFLALEMTEHIPFGSNQLRKVGILDLHAHHGIPTVFVAARNGYRGTGMVRGPAAVVGLVNTASAVSTILPIIEADGMMPNSVLNATTYPQQPVGDYHWLDQIIRILNYSKPAPVATFSDLVTSSYLPWGYKWTPSTLQPLMDCISTAINEIRSGGNPAIALNPLTTFSNGFVHAPQRNRHGALWNWYLVNGGLPSSTACAFPQSAYIPGNLSHHHGARSQNRKATFEPWSSSVNTDFEPFMNNIRLSSSMSTGSRTSVLYPPSWSGSEGVMCWNPPANGPLWNENEYMSLYMDFMWCRREIGFMTVSNRDDRRILFGYSLGRAGDGAYRQVANVFNAIQNQTNVHILEMAWYADFISLDDGVFLGPQWWDLYGGMAAVVANPNLVRLM